MKAMNHWSCGDRQLSLGVKSSIMGILNVTPDSFSDGGRYAEVEAAVKRAAQMLDEGADLVDVGGESTRPGFEAVPEAEEIERVVSTIAGIVAQRPDAIVSIDTSKAGVARAALQAGAKVVNDVWGFQKDPRLAEVAAETKAAVVLMRNGRDGIGDGSILDRIRQSWEHSVQVATTAGIEFSCIVLDPGIGFGTTRQEELEILQELAGLRSFGFPMMIGASRKRITGQPAGLPLNQRVETTVVTTVAGIAAGVDLFRVHDVAENARAAGLADMIYRGGALDE